MNTRIKNIVKDIFIIYFSQEEILRIFSDNEVHLIPFEVSFVKSKEDAFNVCYSSLPVSPEQRDNKFIEVVNEMLIILDNEILKHFFKSEEDRKIFKKLEQAMLSQGYAYDASRKYFKQNVSVSFESPSDEINRLKNELKIDLGKLVPQDIIGKSKELLEATFKLICDERKISYTKDDKFTNLMGKAVDALDLLKEDVTEKDKSIKSLISIINGSSANINEIRNHHGSGHGKNGDYKPVDKPTAIFISNIALSITDYLESRISKA